jgi:hypothetical protein
MLKVLKIGILLKIGIVRDAGCRSAFGAAIKAFARDPALAAEVRWSSQVSKAPRGTLLMATGLDLAKEGRNIFPAERMVIL